MVVELETLLPSQARIMKYGSMDKFLSNKLEANICIKNSCLATMMGFMSASPTSVGVLDTGVSRSTCS
jgi:DUF917 family protein